jgi:hypothetical protein
MTSQNRRRPSGRAGTQRGRTLRERKRLKFDNVWHDKKWFVLQRCAILQGKQLADNAVGTAAGAVAKNKKWMYRQYSGRKGCGVAAHFVDNPLQWMGYQAQLLAVIVFSCALKRCHTVDSTDRRSVGVRHVDHHAG